MAKEEKGPLSLEEMREKLLLAQDPLKALGISLLEWQDLVVSLKTRIKCWPSRLNSEEKVLGPNCRDFSLTLKFRNKISRQRLVEARIGKPKKFINIQGQWEDSYWSYWGPLGSPPKGEGEDKREE